LLRWDRRERCEQHQNEKYGSFHLGCGAWSLRRVTRFALRRREWGGSLDDGKKLNAVLQSEYNHVVFGVAGIGKAR
jgi:hypothetical protein